MFRQGHPCRETSLQGWGEDPQAKRTYLDALRKAATYATFARKQELYVNKARDKGVTAYSIAINDWFSVPRVLLVNIDTWTGKPGQTIRIKARDHVRVTRINVVIRDAQGNVLESGEALPSRTGNIWWKYITKTRVTMTPLPRVEVTAHDLAGNQDTFITC